MRAHTVNRTTLLVLTPMLGLTLAACSSSTTSGPTSPGATTTAASSAPATPSTSVTSGNGCQSIQVTGTTANKDLQALATGAFDSLNCTKTETMANQVMALGNDPALVGKVKAIGGTMQSSDIGGSAGLNMVVLGTAAGAKNSVCQVLGMDTPVKAKSITCGDQ